MTRERLELGMTDGSCGSVPDLRGYPGSSAKLASPDVLRSYTFIADGCRGALLGSSGDVAWMCFPDWADPALFAGLLGSGGVFRIVPQDRHVAGGYYENGTLIWHTRWVTERGIYQSRDAFAYPGHPEKSVLIRRLQGDDGDHRVSLTFAPAADFGRVPAREWSLEDRSFIARVAGTNVRFTGTADMRVEQSPSGATLSADFWIRAGETHDFIAEFSTGTLREPPPDPTRCWESIETAWRTLVPSCQGVIASNDVRRSVAVLRGLTTPGGGTVAAATTSLPERAEHDNSYDYRYCWVRDTCYVGLAGARLEGGNTLLDDSVRWVTARLLDGGPETAPTHKSDGTRVPKPTHTALPGYPGGNDLVGNDAGNQFQLDTFGEALILFAQAAHRGRLDKEGWQACQLAALAIAERWQEADAGLWEIEPRMWTHSRLICVAGLRAISAARPKDWRIDIESLAHSILEETSVTSLHAKGWWRRARDDDDPDASLLLAQIRGALPPNDRRSVLTRQEITNRLTQDHYVYRYLRKGTPLGEAEGAFLICNFWMSLADSQANEPVAAARWFERGRSAMSTSGLFSEEYDVEEHQLRGNLPQAFVHALFIESAGTQSERLE